MPPRPYDPRRIEQGWTRRSVVEWLGKATVVALGAELVAACSAAEDFGASGGSCDAPQFPFRPTREDLERFDGWNVRTVDPQELVALLASWRLVVDGLVETPVELSFADLLKLPRRDQVTDFHCVEGWSVLDVPWHGVHLSILRDLVEPLPSATHLTFTSFGDVYTESLPLDVALEPRTLLAYGVDCSTLPLEHGFPLRLVVPRKFAYKSAKTVRRIEFTDGPIEGYWQQYGYPYDADVEPERLRVGKY